MERQDEDGSTKRHDVRRDVDAVGEAGTAGRGGDDLVMTATGTQEVAEFAAFSAEAVGGVMALEASHTSGPAFDTEMVLFEPVVQVSAGLVPGCLPSMVGIALG